MDQFENVLKNELKPGEEVLWQGQPIPKLLTKRSLKAAAYFSILPIVFLLLSFHHTRSLFSDVSIIWWILLALILGSPFKAYSRAKKRLYLLTNQRAIVISLSPRLSVASYDKESLTNYTKTYNADGAGDIIFGGMTSKTARPNLMNKFLALKDVKYVSERIDQLVKSPA